MKLKNFTTSKLQSKKLLSIILSFIFILLISDTTKVWAANGIEISTSYTGIEAEAGEEIEFPLTINNYNSNGQGLDLVVSSIPEGWESNIVARSRNISSVFIEPNSSVSADLEIKIPMDATDGEYSVLVQGINGGVLDELELNIKVKEIEIEDSKLSVEYPDLEGTGKTSFNFRVDLTNNSAEAQSYSLEAGVPRGWEASFSPAASSEQIASITVEPNTNQGLDITIKAPELVSEGEYTIPIIAKSAEETLRTELKVIIKGTYDINLSTPTGLLSAEARAGKEKMIKLTVTNNGSSDLKDIEFTSWEPTNWEVRFETKEIDVLKAGESKEVIAYVKPDSKAISGDYVVEMTAKTPEDSSSAEFRITVRTSTLWGAVGIVILILLAGGLYWLINKYGRR